MTTRNSNARTAQSDRFGIAGRSSSGRLRRREAGPPCSLGEGVPAKNDHKAAVIQLKNALQQDPATCRSAFSARQGAARGGDPTGAEVELRKAQDQVFCRRGDSAAGTHLLMLGSPTK
jgi:hypothetical protein